jgi:L-cystine uptake protein TcyP (sodium:dicarboxylate symporter family)
MTERRTKFLARSSRVLMLLTLLPLSGWGGFVLLRDFGIADVAGWMRYLAFVYLVPLTITVQLYLRLHQLQEKADYLTAEQYQKLNAIVTTKAGGLRLVYSFYVAVGICTVVASMSNWQSELLAFSFAYVSLLLLSAGVIFLAGIFYGFEEVRTFQAIAMLEHKQRKEREEAIERLRKAGEDPWNEEGLEGAKRAIYTPAQDDKPTH